MENAILIQIYLLVIYIISGIVIGIFFDIFRILRKSFKTSDIVTYIQDSIFWIGTGIFLLFVLFNFSNGEIRSYTIIGLILGVLIYMLFISKPFIKVSVKIIVFIKQIMMKTFSILLYPLKILINIIQKILLKPFTFLVINMKNINSKIYKNIQKKIKNINIMTKNKKNGYGKKDFKEKCRKV